ncbi:MAG TPA: nitrate- and nitrite sensing domain-containing protein [Actinomycetes bacterium]
MLVIPAVAFLVVAGLGIGTTIRDAQAFDRGSRLAGLGRQATALAHELQSERDRTAGYIDSRRRADVGAGLIADQRSVDQAAVAYREAESGLHDRLGARLQGKLDAVLAQLAQLGSLRSAIASGSLTRQAIFDEYSQIIGALLSVDAEIAQPGGDEELDQSVRALNDLSRAKEVSAQIRGTLYAIAFRGSFAFGEAQRFADLVAQQQAALNQFQAEANEQQRTLYANLVRGQAVLTAFRTQQAAQDRQSSPRLGIDPQQWFAATTIEVEVMRAVESQLLDDVIKQSQDLSAAAKRRSTTNAVLIAVILGVALLALLVVARSMAGPLQRLRSRALDVAEHRLPQAVERLSTSERGDLDIRVEPIGIQSQDEIGQVAQAVDAIQQVAVQLATEQAALRQSIGDMFTNLALRSQTLIDRQLELIEDLERNEESPELLDQLFRLDHLATRMRRNAEDLIVLSGAETSRHWSQPMTLVDVVRAAVAEVEEYQRVELLPLAEIEITGNASIDIIHLLAELVENATVFSPPTTKVQIAGQAVPHGYVIEIEDRGLGMSEEELLVANERLANPPEIDFALSRVLGLYVVGRLAQRHGIRVQLRHSWYGGITALTLLPHSVLVWSDDLQAMPEPVAVPQGELPSPPPEQHPAIRRRPVQPAVEAGDRLPIFEAARSEWFVEEHSDEQPEQHGPPEWHQPEPTEPPGSFQPFQPSEPAGRHEQPAPPPLPVRPKAQPRPPAPAFPEPSPVAEPPLIPEVDRPMPPFRLPGFQRQRLAADAGVPQQQPEAQQPEAQQPEAEPAAPGGGADPQSVRLTGAGLPRRVPRANLAPGISATPPTDPPDRGGRSPDEVRSILSNYRSGLERGRLAASDLEASDLPDEVP